MSEPLTFTVYGHAAPAGSKRALPFGGRAGGRPIIVDDSKRSRPWKQEIAGVARETMDGRELYDEPLALVLVFYVPRPRSHYGARGLRPTAPEYPAKRPDLLKLARGVEDALSSIVYRDDALIVDEHLSKRYGEPERLEVTVGPAAILPIDVDVREAVR